MSKIIQQIRDAFPDLAPSKKKAASYFLNNFSTLHLDTVMELADKIGVSDTTIINLCSDLGFYGYSGFKKAVRDEIKSESLVSDQESDADINEITSAVLGRCSKDMRALELTLADKENQLAIEKSMALLQKARKIYVVGFYRNAGLAKANVIPLIHKGYDAEAIYPDMGDYIDHLLRCTEDDTAIVYDPSLYTTALTEICAFLKERKVSIILVTDMGPCPRLELADATIHCMTGGDVNASTGVVSFAIVSEILSVMMAQDPCPAIEYNQSLRQGIFSKFNAYGVYEPSSDCRIGRI